MLGLGFTSFFFNPSLSLSGMNIWWGRTGRVDWQRSQMWSVNKPNQNWDSFQTRRKHRQRRCNQSTFGSIYWEATQTNEHKVGERRRFPSSSRSFLHVSSSLLHFKSIYIPTTLYYTRTPTSSPLFVCLCVFFSDVVVSPQPLQFLSRWQISSRSYPSFLPVWATLLLKREEKVRALMHKVTADTSPKSMVTFGHTSSTLTLDFQQEKKKKTGGVIVDVSVIN